MAEDLMATTEAILSDSQNIKALVDADTPAKVKEVMSGMVEEVREKVEGAAGDPRAYLSVIKILGSVVIIVALTYTAWTILPLLVQSPKQPMALPDALIALGSAALGALAGILAPTPRS